MKRAMVRMNHVPTFQVMITYIILGIPKLPPHECTLTSVTLEKCSTQRMYEVSSFLGVPQGQLVHVRHYWLYGQYLASFVAL